MNDENKNRATSDEQEGNFSFVNEPIDPKANPDDSAERQALIDDFQQLQNIPYALIGGVLASLLSAILWAVVTVATNYQIGFMAIAVGLVVGFSIRFFGAGTHIKFGIIGAILAFLGCIFGNLLSQVGFIAKEYSLNYLEVIGFLDIPTIISLMTESFHPMDIMFYGIAIYEAFRFSVFPEDFISQSKIDNIHKWRLPAAIAAGVILIVVLFFIGSGYSGHKIYTYESGVTMSEGEIRNNKYEGEWRFYDEEGNLTSKGSFAKDMRDGPWEWYLADGTISRKGSYVKGLEEGLWEDFYENGTISSKVLYKYGRQNGTCTVYHENGVIYETGDYVLDLRSGPWKSYYDNGQLKSEGNMTDNNHSGDWKFYHENGRLEEERHYVTDTDIDIKNSWDEQGKPIIKDGNGKYTTYWMDGKTVMTTGDIKDSHKVGLWKSYYPDSRLQEEGLYENAVYKLINYWDENGKQTITNGNGQYIAYWQGDTVSLQYEIRNGLKQGTYKLYSPDGVVLNETNYVNGDYDGEIRTYSLSGILTMEGQFVNGKKEGSWTWYNEDGTLSSSATFVNGKKEGKQIFYDSDRNITKTEIYKTNELLETKLGN